MLNWIYFTLLASLGYLGVSIFSQLTGANAQSYTELLKNVIKPLPLLIMVVANMFLASAVYFGFLATSTAIPIMLSIGIITSLLYSVFALGAVVTLTKIVGVAFIIIGIYLLK